MARALRARGARPRAHQPEPDGRRASSSTRKAWWSGRAPRSGRAGRTPRSIALADAGSRARGATLYCTLEPCSHTGRTGPCAPSVADAGIGRAVIAVEDPNPLVSGRGARHASANAASTVTTGVGREARGARIGPFFSVMRERPSLRDHQGRAERATARSRRRRGPHAADRPGRGPADSPGAGGDGRDRGRVGHHAG